MRKKQFAREFLSFEVMIDALYLTTTIDSKYNIRVPLGAQVDYKGFRAIAVATIPISPKDGLVLGFNSTGQFQMLDYQLKMEFKYIGEVLNLKDSKTKIKLT